MACRAARCVLRLGEWLDREVLVLLPHHRGRRKAGAAGDKAEPRNALRGAKVVLKHLEEELHMWLIDVHSLRALTRRSEESDVHIGLSAREN